MPTDASIPLSVQFPRLNDPVQEYGRMISIQGLQQKQQQEAQLAPLLYQQEQSATQQAQIKAQQAQQSQKDNDIWNQAYKNAGGDLEQAKVEALANGASTGSMLHYQAAHDTEIANRAKAWTADHEVQLARNDMLLGSMRLFRQKPEADRNAQWPNWVDQQHQNGGLSDADYMATITAHPKDKPPTGQELDDYMAMKTTASYLDNQAKLKSAQDLALATARTRAMVQQSTMQKNQIAIDEKNRQDLLDKARGAKDLDQYNQTLLDAGAPMDTFGDPPFDPVTKQPDPKGMTRLNRLGMNSTQISQDDRAERTAAETAIRDANTSKFRERSLAQGDQRIAISQQNADHPRVSDEKDAAADVANKYFRENEGDADKAIAALINSQDPADQKYLLQAKAILTQSKTNDNRATAKSPFTTMEEMQWYRKHLQNNEPMPKTRAEYEQGMGIKKTTTTPATTAPPVQTTPANTQQPPQAQASPYAKPGPYLTSLNPSDEAKFQSWVKTNQIPFDPSPTADYDMRGYWKSQQAGGQGTQVSQYDGQPHFPDTFKTPYHKTFSNESKYATADAPSWKGDRLIDKSGKVIADETPGTQPPPAAAPQTPAAAPAKKAATGPPPAKGGGFTVRLPPDLAARFGGKSTLRFPDKDSARKFAAAAGFDMK